MCWKVGLVLYVVIKKTSRRGKLKAKKGTKWLFQPDGWRKQSRCVPFGSGGTTHLPLEPWSEKVVCDFGAGHLAAL